MGAAAFLLILYCIAYSQFRSRITTYVERDGCPPDGCEVVHLDHNSAYYYIFNPLVHLDRFVSRGVEFRNER